MYHLTVTSFLTLGLSLTTVGFLNYTKKACSRASQKATTILDQTVRAFMLSFAIYHLGAELLEDFGMLQLSSMSIGFLSLSYIIQIILARHSNTYLQENNPWFIYTLLIPHFIGEGFAIAPQANHSSINLMIAGFLIHKTIELAMITTSTNNQIHNKTQRIALQTLFVLITPLSILMYGASSGIASSNSWLMHAAEFLNFIVFIQLATFCQFCTHNANNCSSWLQKNQTFLMAFIGISALHAVYPGLLF